jgi:5-methylcytosine-specific restriction endonuclease McrA
MTAAAPCKKCGGPRVRPGGKRRGWICRPCAAEGARQWRLENPERSKAHVKRWRDEHPGKVNEWSRNAYAKIRATNPEALREKTRRWRAANPDKVKKARRAAYAADPERHKAYHRKWVEKNPEWYLDKNKRRYAQIRGAGQIERFARLEIYERDSGRCHLCGRWVPREKFTLDHLIPVSAGGPHTRANVAVAHLSCNSSRQAGRLPAQLLLIGERL